MSAREISPGVMARLVSLSLQRHVPLNVHFDITYRCNERCIHCYLDHEDHGEMKTAEIKNVLDQLKEAGTLFLTFSGGEIFVRDDCFELLEYAHKLHFDLTIKTNGLGTDAARAQRLRQLGVRRVQLSVYSAEAAVHDEITKVKGSFVRTIAAVKHFKEAGLVVKIACPLMPQNTGSYRSFMRLAHELDVPYTMDPTITGKLDGDMSLLTLRQPMDELVEILNDPELRPNDCDDSTMDLAESLSESYHDIPCSAGHNNVYISPYGEVWPCIQLPVAAGNLRKQRFEDIWYGSPALRRVREVRDSEVPVCSTCSIREYCERCPGLALTEQFDLNGPSERACQLAEKKAQLAGVENAVSAFHLLVQRGSDAQERRQPSVTLVTIAPMRA